MIQADHKFWAKKIFKRFVKRILKKNFNAFTQTNDVPNLSSSKATLITPNHISWYDGFFVYYLFDQLWKKDKNFYLMMLEEQLKKYWFFKKVGAFSIHPTSPISSYKTFEYIQKLSQNPDNIIVLYPQGKIEPYEKTQLQPGLSFLIKKMQLDIDILPVHFRIQYGNTQKPDLFFRFQKTVTSSDFLNSSTFYEKQFIDNRDDLARFIYTKKAGINWFGRP